jgi:spore cortex formation protein SpoVR/YcgB (stage V sporulation)
VTYKRDLYDLIEYVKWITNETSILRQRVRAAEHVISQLRRSGESSVESLLDTLYILRKKQEKLDAEANALRMDVQTKEAIIKKREEEKGSLKAAIEIQRAEQDFDFSKLRKQLDD